MRELNVTANEFQNYARSLPVQQLMEMADLYNELQNPSAKDIMFRNVANNEVERRINNWEIAEV